MCLRQKLLDPSTLVLLAANAIPLAGVLLWHWDVFLLLMLYWMETLVIGVWTLAAVAVSPGDAMGKSAQNQSRLFLVPFFTVHSGIFMSAHFLFLWDLFAGAWAARVHNVRDFIAVIVIGTGLWLPLVALFISRGFSFLLSSYGAHFIPDRFAFLRPRTEETRKSGSVLFGFYGRIVTMHVAIIFGGFLAQHIGAMAPLLLLIALKVAADLGFHFKFDLADDEKPKAVAATTP